jgi:ABC-type multidrug transport system permease subunit
MIAQLYNEFDKLLQSPFKTVIFATGNLVASLTSWLVLGTTIFGFIGAFCTAFLGIVGIVSWWHRNRVMIKLFVKCLFDGRDFDVEKTKILKRRSSDK